MSIGTQQVSHIVVEQEHVTLPTVKAAAPTPAPGGDGHPFQLLLVPPTSRLSARGGQRVAESRLISEASAASPAGGVAKPLETCLNDPPKVKYGNASSVSVGGSIR